VLQVSSAWTAITGYSLRDIPNMENWLQFVSPESAPDLRAKLSDLAAGSSALFDTEFAIRTLAGEWRHWKFTAGSPGSLPDGRRLCVAMAVDITDRMRTEAELLASRDAVEAASAMKDQFLANISHELRTPLSVILIWSKLMASGGMTEAEMKDATSAVLRSADTQRRLIEDLLDTTRIASGKLRVSLRPVVLAGIVESAVETLRPVASVKKILLELAVADRTTHVMADPIRLEQIVWILVHNAIKFSPESSTVRIELRRERSSLVLTVRDHGAGIAPEFLTRLFQPFTQAATETGRGATGLGLGLSIARSLVQHHNGTISASSTGPEQGAEFVVRLPVHLMDDDTYADAVPPDPLALKGVATLVVEDNADAMHALSRALVGAGAVVTECSSAIAALEELERVAPRLIVSDISMPDMDGHEFIQQVRSMEAQRGLEPAHAIAVTAKSAQRDRDAARLSGFDRFLSKPIDPDVLIAMASELLASRRA
jgi:PAS domain S-box-containing protein